MFDLSASLGLNKDITQLVVRFESNHMSEVPVGGIIYCYYNTIVSPIIVMLMTVIFV